MRKQRDEKGRFLPGNQVALRNKGNQSPKYGNQNAKKHGFYSKSNFTIRFQVDGSICVYTLAGFTYLVQREEWARDESGRIWIADEAAENLKRIGVHLEQSQEYKEIADISQPIPFQKR